VNDHQYELDGFRFGRGLPVQVAAFSRGAPAIVHQDVQRPGRDGLLMGRDVRGGAEWVFDLLVKADGEQGATVALRELGSAWGGRDYAPGDLSVLRYRSAGRTRRVYGRARQFEEFAVPHGQDAGLVPALATFQLADPLHYDDEARVLDLALTTTPEGVLTLPATLPWVLGGRAGQRQGEVHVGGDAPVPFEVTFYGPATGSASGFWAQGAGWRIDLDATLAWDQSATIDTRASTVTRSDGRSLAGAARGRFLTARLSPGQQEISWGCTDATGTARMTLTHRPGYYSI